jgi:hypothetical protein
LSLCAYIGATDAGVDFSNQGTTKIPFQTFQKIQSCCFCYVPIREQRRFHVFTLEKHSTVDKRNINCGIDPHKLARPIYCNTRVFQTVVAISFVEILHAWWYTLREVVPALATSRTYVNRFGHVGVLAPFLLEKFESRLFLELARHKLFVVHWHSVGTPHVRWRLSMSTVVAEWNISACQRGSWKFNRSWTRSARKWRQGCPHSFAWRQGPSRVKFSTFTWTCNQCMVCRSVTWALHSEPERPVALTDNSFANFEQFLFLLSRRLVGKLSTGLNPLLSLLTVVERNGKSLCN